jgi:hypothetical protein
VSRGGKADAPPPANDSGRDAGHTVDTKA